MPTKFKLILGLFLLGTLVSGAVLVSDVQDNESITLRVAHVNDPTHTAHKALLYFKEELAKVSNGKIDLEVYASSQLGSERDSIELLQIGSLAMSTISVGPLESFVPEMQVFSLPYVFEDKAHFWRVAYSDLGQELLESPLSVDLRGLGFFEYGSRSFYTCNKPISAPEELEGMKIRVMKSQSAVALMEELGASATPISYGELYTALQQGVVDGAENSPVSFYKARHFEICRNFTLDEHNTIPGLVLFSEKIWQQLSAEQQAWLRSAMYKTVLFQRELWESDTQAALAALKADGVNIIYPDKAPFREAVVDFKASFKGTPIGDILDRIEAQR